MSILFALLACSRGDPSDALRPDPLAREQLMDWSRPPGGTWTLNPVPIAWNWSSLHAAVIDDEIVLVGHDRSYQIQAWEERHPRFFIDALVSADGTTWTGRRYWGEGETGGVDPAFVEDDQGWGAWVAHTDGVSGDPGDPQRAIQLMRAPMAGNSLGTPVAWSVATNVFDPAPVLFQGKLHVYGTNQARFVVEAMPNGQLSPIWENATVPFARVHQGELQLVAQQVVPGRSVRETIMHNGKPTVVENRTDDRRLPFLRTSRDGVTWTEPELIAEDERVRSCTAPVLVDFRGIEHLYCINERMN